MRITINPTSKKSINNAIKQVKAYKERLATLEKTLLRRLASIGVTNAKVYFASAINQYDGNGDIEVAYLESLNKVSIIASGEAVAFIEFGAGVYYNGTGAYPKELPPNIVGIGQYGKGHGKNKAWGFYMEGENGEKNVIITRGNPPAKAMYQAEIDIIEQVSDIAREVFKS